MNPKFFLLRLNNQKEIKQMEKLKKEAEKENRSATNYIKFKLWGNKK